MLHNGDQARPGRSHYTLHIPRHTFPRSLCPVGDWPGARTRDILSDIDTGRPGPSDVSDVSGPRLRSTASSAFSENSFCPSLFEYFTGLLCIIHPK